MQQRWIVSDDMGACCDWDEELAQVGWQFRDQNGVEMEVEVEWKWLMEIFVFGCCSSKNERFWLIFEWLVYETSLI